MSEQLSCHQLTCCVFHQVDVCCILPLLDKQAPDKQEHEIVSIDFIIEQHLVCIVERVTGQILTYDSESGTASLAATFSEGIESASWSPDQEILLLVTSNNRIVQLTQSFEVICETDVNPSGSGAAESVAVGWGSAKTQFQGSSGKGSNSSEQVSQ